MGGIVSSIFGGGNSYKAKLPPGMSKEEYQKQMNALNDAVQRSMSGNIVNYGEANKTLAQQQGLANQLLAQGRGEGPNPALDQLRMTTDANIRNQAAMAASQRGINPALAARMAGQNAANTQQTAAGQAALQSAQQQLGAQQAAGGLLGGIGQQQAQQALSQIQMGINQEALRRQAQAALQGNVNNAWNSQQSINAGVASQNANTAGQYGMGLLGGLASAIGGKYKGGIIENPFAKAKKKKGYANGGVAGYADGGDVKDQDGVSGFLDHLFSKFENNPQENPTEAPKTPLASSAPTYIPSQAPTNDAQAFLANQQNQNARNQGGQGMMNAGLSKLGSSMTGGPIFDFLHSIIGGGSTMGGALAGGSEAGGGAAAGEAGGATEGAGGIGALMMAAQGGNVPGNAPMPGDSKRNDVVPAMLSPGEGVIPRSKMDDPAAAHAFLDHLLRTTEGNYGEILMAKRRLHELCGGGMV